MKTNEIDYSRPPKKVVREKRKFHFTDEELKELVGYGFDEDLMLKLRNRSGSLELNVYHNNTNSGAKEEITDNECYDVRFYFKKESPIDIENIPGYFFRRV